MKRIISFLLCFLLIFTLPFSASAKDAAPAASQQVIDLGNGLIAIDEIQEAGNARAAMGKTVTRTRTIKDGDTVVAIITIQATFRYDGTTVSVVSKGINQADTFAGWNYEQISFTSSGGTVTLEAKLTKWLIFNTPFTMTLSCDKDGNIY